MYWDALGHYSLVKMGKACRYLSHNCEFFPKPVDFKEYIGSMSAATYEALPEPELTDDEKQWSRSFYSYRQLYIMQPMETKDAVPDWSMNKFREYMIGQGFTGHEVDYYMAEYEMDNQHMKEVEDE